MRALFLFGLALSILPLTASASNECTLAPEFQKCTTAFKGAPIVEKDPVVGLKYVKPEEVIPHIKDSSWLFVDTRPKELFEQCHIRDSVNLVYEFPESPNNILTKEKLQEAIAAGKTLVFYCNDLACYRGLNAAVEACKWSIPLNKIKWLGLGVPGVVRSAGKDYRKYHGGKLCGSLLN